MKSKIILILVSLLCYSLKAFSMTGDEVLTKLNERLISAETLKGKIIISYKSGQIYSGIFMYMNPGKIYVKLMEPPGKVIVTNGKKLWVYDSLTDVCGVQELETEEAGADKETGEKSNEINVKLRAGIQRYFQGYETKLVSENPSQYTVELNNDNRKFSDIQFILDSDFMLMSADFNDKNGDGFVIKLSDVKTGEKITPGLFNFNVPAEAQVIKNPLDIR